MIRVTISPELVVETLREGARTSALVVSKGLPKGARLVWIRPDLGGAREKLEAVELLFAEEQETRDSDPVLLGRAFVGIGVRDVTPTFERAEPVVSGSKREAVLAGVATQLAALLEMHTEPGPGAERDDEVKRALAWYQEAIRA